MDYKLGNSKKINEFGVTPELSCLKCGENVQLSVFTNLDTFLVPKFPLIKSKNVYFLVCPKCAGIFTADVKKENIKRKDKMLNISSDDLKELDIYE